MSSHRDIEPAFICNQVGQLPIGSSAWIQPPLCPRRRARTTTSQWRCVTPIDSNSNQTGESDGIISLDSLDTNFEAALSKGWDDLQLFNADAGSKSEGLIQPMEMPKEDKKKEIDTEQEEDLEMVEPTSVTHDALSVDEQVEQGNEKTEKPISKTKRKSATKKKTTKKKKTTVIAKEDEKQELSQADIDYAEKWDESPRWFCLQVKPGCEQSCAISVRNMSQALVSLRVQEVLVPSTKIMRLTKGGQSVKKEERFFPGYILVLMVMNRQNYADIRSVPNVQYFMGDPNRDKKKDQPFRPPVPLSDADIKTVFDKIAQADRAKPERKTSIRPGDTIKAIAGPFQDQVGRVMEVKPDLNVVIANLVVFGRESATELKFDQVKVVDDVILEEESEMDMAEEEEREGNKQTSTKKVAKSTDAKKSFTAGVASANDDLSFLLDDFDNDDSWSEAEFEDRKGFQEARDSFMQGPQVSDKKQKSSSQKEEVLSEDDELDALLGESDNNPWQPESSREKPNSEKKKSKRDPLFLDDQDDEDDDLLSSFFDEIDEAVKREERGNESGTRLVQNRSSDTSKDISKDMPKFDFNLNPKDDDDSDFDFNLPPVEDQKKELFGDDDDDAFQEAEIGAENTQ